MASLPSGCHEQFNPKRTADGTTAGAKGNDADLEFPLGFLWDLLAWFGLMGGCSWKIGSRRSLTKLCCLSSLVCSGATKKQSPALRPRKPQPQFWYSDIQGASGRCSAVLASCRIAWEAQRRGNAGIKIWHCARSACTLSTSKCRCHVFAALGSTKWPWRAKCGLRLFCLGLAAPTGYLGPRSKNSSLRTQCMHGVDQR